ncbi:unnamed protein product [Ceratitis capitata]|uniref:(Mediterranean fruit fly) hypothetical protein n=1 Tax=Ceratitis capitata TaxID=7213 RepID=A0A811VJZ9_CERCA|nr:unnamed protein product [Ceratitis capitata]
MRSIRRLCTYIRICTYLPCEPPLSPRRFSFSRLPRLLALFSNAVCLKNLFTFVVFANFVLFHIDTPAAEHEILLLLWSFKVAFVCLPTEFGNKSRAALEVFKNAYEFLPCSEVWTAVTAAAAMAVTLLPSFYITFGIFVGTVKCTTDSNNQRNNNSSNNSSSNKRNWVDEELCCLRLEDKSNSHNGDDCRCQRQWMTISGSATQIRLKKRWSSSNSSNGYCIDVALTLEA